MAVIHGLARVNPGPWGAQDITLKSIFLNKYSELSNNFKYIFVVCGSLFDITIRIDFTSRNHYVNL